MTDTLDTSYMHVCSPWQYARPRDLEIDLGLYTYGTHHVPVTQRPQPGHQSTSSLGMVPVLIMQRAGLHGNTRMVHRDSPCKAHETRSAWTAGQTHMDVPARSHSAYRMPRAPHTHQSHYGDGCDTRSPSILSIWACAGAWLRACKLLDTASTDGVQVLVESRRRSSSGFPDMHIYGGKSAESNRMGCDT